MHSLGRSFAAFLAVVPLWTSEPAQAANAAIISSPTEQVIVQEGPARISYRFDGSDIQFSGKLPAGWSFNVSVDGDQNGIWGLAPGESVRDAIRSPDFTIAQDALNGIFCGQYVFAPSSSNPDEIYESSDCEAFKTSGYVRIGQMQSDRTAQITYNIPAGIMFAGKDTMAVQVCIWDTKTTKCHFSPAKPYMIKRP